MIPHASTERTRVLVLTHTGGSEMGWATGWYPDGTAYCILDSGSQGNFPVGSVRVIEDKDKPRAGMETKGAAASGDRTAAAIRAWTRADAR